MTKRGGLMALPVLSLAASAALADIPAGNTTAVDPWAQADTHRLGAAAGLQQVRDWTVACDNLGDCTAISLSRVRTARLARSDPGDYALPLLMVARSHAGAAWRVTVDYRQLNFAPPLAGLQLHVMRDGSNQIGPGYPLTQITPGHYALDPEAVDSFLINSRRSSRAAVTMQGHGVHGTLSTAGLSASLTAINARQQTVRPGIARDPQRARQEVFTPVSLTIDDAQRLHRLGCNLGRPPLPASFIAARSLDGAVLTGQICGDASSDYRIWLVQRGRFAAEPAALPTPDQARGTVIEGGVQHSTFNMDNGELTALRPMRSRGDCGWQRRWRWSAAGFNLIETRIMPFCVGLPPASWPVIYRAP